MTRWLYSLLLLAGSVSAQQLVRVDADCPIGGAGFVLTRAGTVSTVIDNRQSGCSNWTVAYSQVTAGALQIELQGAPDNNGVPGAWATFATGSVSVGANPSTSTPSGLFNISSGYLPWVRVLSDSQTANILGYVFGSRTNASGGGGSSGGGCPGTLTTPCVVVGKVIGDMSSQPVEIGALSPGGLVQLIADTLGNLVVISPTVSVTPGDGEANTAQVVPGFSNSGSPSAAFQLIYPYIFNGTTWDRQFYSTGQVRISVTAGTAQLLVPQSVGTTTRLTHVSFAANAAANVEIVQGTTVSTPCDTTPTILSGPYENVTALALDFGTGSPLTDTAANLDTCILFSGTVTAGGVAKFAQY